jgi:hypothetical protein
MREVLVHRRRRTVHELRADGTTRCGNGLNRPDDYEQMKANEVPARARSCLRCVWIVERRPFG